MRRDNSERALRCRCPRRPPAAGVLARGRREDHAARRLAEHVLRDLADEVLQRAAAAAQPAAPADARRLLRAEDDHLDAAPARLLHDRVAGLTRADGRGRHLDALVLLPHRLRAPQRRAGLVELRVGQPGVDGQRHGDLEHPERLDRRALALGLVGVLVGGQAPGGLDDVVVQRRAEDRDEDRSVLRALDLPPQRGLRHEDAAEHGLAVGDPVDDVHHDPERHPREADVARALVQDAERDERAGRDDCSTRCPRPVS